MSNTISAATLPNPREIYLTAYVSDTHGADMDIDQFIDAFVKFCEDHGWQTYATYGVC